MVDVNSIYADLHETLQRVAELAATAKGDWWVFGGAAAALYGVDGTDAHDVGVLMSPTDAKQVLAEHGISGLGDGGTSRFRSTVFGNLKHLGPLPIDVLAGFEVNRAGTWVPVQFSSPVAIQLPIGTVSVPKLDELIELFRLCGRPKDLERAAKLEGRR